MVAVAVLTYHSQNISGSGYAENDHVAFASDLLTLSQMGLRIISLSQLVSWLVNRGPDGDVRDTVCLTFDDGCDFDVRDLDYPGHGLQRSFLGIMEDFVRQAGPEALPGLHATSFVIASRDARRIIDEKRLFGRGWISDDWWPEADGHPLMRIENHGWDHNHPDLEGENRGGFRSVDSHTECLQQVVRAGSAIEAATGRWPEIFAYPFGESSTYLRESFFPEHAEVHGCLAAMGTDASAVTRNSNRWNLPRYVCGRDWRSPEMLQTLLAANP